MRKLGEFITDGILGPFNPFKILNSVDNSVGFCKKDLPRNTKEAKHFLVDARVNVIGKKLNTDLRVQE